MNIVNELNIQKKNLELLNLLETRCEGLENLLCKNVINIISKKIDSIEKRFSYDSVPGIEKKPVIKAETNANIEDDKIFALNNNTSIIEKGFKKIISNPASDTTDIINKKIEENYRLLDELERTNRPIFTKTTDLNNRMYIEDKLKEMDDKLGVLFSVNNPKAVEYKKNEDINDFSRDVSFNQNKQFNDNAPTEFNNDSNVINPADEKINKENDLKKKKEELYNKLSDTEKRIKNIAGSLLKNF